MRLSIYFRLLILMTIVSCSAGSTRNKTGHHTKFHDRKKEMSKFTIQKKFKESDNTAVFTTKFVTENNKEITEVHHEKEGNSWLFFSADHYNESSNEGKVISLGQIIKTDSTLFEIADMPVGCAARRKFIGDKWVIEKKK